MSEITRVEDQQLAEIVRRLVDALRPERIYLFGSQARGQATTESDYDVLVIVRQAASEPFYLERLAYQSLIGLGIPVDVVVMSLDYFERRQGVVASLPATVEREGKLLYAA